MMYVACKKLRVGSGRQVAIGQPVPEALSWSPAVLQAHLNMGWIKGVETTPSTSEAHSDEEVTRSSGSESLEVSAPEVAESNGQADSADMKPIEVIVCPDCKKTFKNKAGLSKHIKTHIRQ